MKTRTVALTEIDYSELDEMVTKFLNAKGIRWRYPRPQDQKFTCVAEQEWGNDQDHSFDVDGEIDEDNKARILHGHLGWQLGNILNWMAADGEIAKGEYKVEVCW